MASSSALSTEPETAAIERSWWSTADLQRMALAWHPYDAPSSAAPIRESVIGCPDIAEARDFYARMLAEDEPYARYLAAEALAHSGWTIDRINYRKS